MTRLTNRNITAYGRRRCHRQSVMTGFITIRSIFACNDFVDDQIGRVINALTPEQRENTWVIYTSDHGEMMGAHKLISKGAAMYDDITRIPLIIRSPQGGAATGRYASQSYRFTADNDGAGRY
ncbi:sulfatase-like hydrolase/transferase [Escherichia coli]